MKRMRFFSLLLAIVLLISITQAYQDDEEVLELDLDYDDELAEDDLDEMIDDSTSSVDDDVALSFEEQNIEAEDEEEEDDEFDGDDSVFEKETAKMNFRSFHVGALASKLNEMKNSGEDKQFFLDKELQQHFSHVQLPRIHIDFVHVNNITRPTYSEVYPEQEFKQKRSDMPAEAAVNEAEQQSTTFKTNNDLLANVFKMGLRPMGDQFSKVKYFPYEDDNNPKIIDSLSIRRLYDVTKRKYNNALDATLGDLDLEINYRFSIREVEFNSALNADMRKALANAEDEFELMRPILTDYELNQRQYVIYIVDCEALDCQSESVLKLRDYMASRNKGLEDFHWRVPFKILFSKLSTGVLANEVKKTIEALYLRGEIRSSNATDFLVTALLDLYEYVTKNIIQDLATFKRIMAQFSFESPLNFIMVPHDFHQFFSVFYHAKMLARYLANIETDSLFSVYNLRSPADKELQVNVKTDSLNKKKLALTMSNALKNEIQTAVELLTQYHHLVEHDQQSCQEITADSTYRQRMSCFTRKYGMTLSSLFAIGSLCLLHLYCLSKSSIGKRERKLR